MHHADAWPCWGSCLMITSWGNDVSVDIAAANYAHHGSLDPKSGLALPNACSLPKAPCSWMVYTWGPFGGESCDERHGWPAKNENAT